MDAYKTIFKLKQGKQAAVEWLISRIFKEKTHLLWFSFSFSIINNATLLCLHIPYELPGLYSPSHPRFTLSFHKLILFGGEKKKNNIILRYFMAENY